MAKVKWNRSFGRKAAKSRFSADSGGPSLHFWQNRPGSQKVLKRALSGRPGRDVEFHCSEEFNLETEGFSKTSKKVSFLMLF